MNVQDQKMEYWRNLISMVRRTLSDKCESEAVNVVANGQLKAQIIDYDNWDGGTNSWDIAFKLKYKDYMALKDKEKLERTIRDTILTFHKDESEFVASVSIEPIIERQIDWKAVIPETKESTINLILEQQQILTDHATGQASFKTPGAEEDYQRRHQKILRISSKAGFEYPIGADSLVQWWNTVKVLPTWAERRNYISNFFSPLLKTLRESDNDAVGVSFTQIVTRSDAVKKAIEDAEIFIRKCKYDSAVDRVHTAFQGYLREILNEYCIPCSMDDSLPSLYNKLHEFYGVYIHPADVASRIKTIMRSGSGMVNSVNELRNNNTVAHPSGTLIEGREARLVIKMVDAMVEYIESVESIIEND